MYDQDITLERRLKAKDKLIAELLAALERVESELIDVEMEIPEYVTEAIRTAKG